MAAAKIRAIKELVATPIKTTPNLDHILIILSELHEGEVLQDGMGYYLCQSISRELYRSLSADTIRTLRKMGVVVEEAFSNICFEMTCYRVHARCDESGVLDVDTSVLDELEK
jgi:hypothetical protein